MYMTRRSRCLRQCSLLDSYLLYSSGSSRKNDVIRGDRCAHASPNCLSFFKMSRCKNDSPECFATGLKRSQFVTFVLGVVFGRVYGYAVYQALRIAFISFLS